MPLPHTAKRVEDDVLVPVAEARHKFSRPVPTRAEPASLNPRWRVGILRDARINRAIRYPVAHLRFGPRRKLFALPRHYTPHAPGPDLVYFNAAKSAIVRLGRCSQVASSVKSVPWLPAPTNRTVLSR